MSHIDRAISVINRVQNEEAATMRRYASEGIAVNSMPIVII
jgi:hypothetical protein